jgi:hypothetical protein
LSKFFAVISRVVNGPSFQSLALPPAFWSSIVIFVLSCGDRFFSAKPLMIKVKGIFKLFKFKNSDLACRRTMSVENDFQVKYGPKTVLRCDHLPARG